MFHDPNCPKCRNEIESLSPCLTRAAGTKRSVAVLSVAAPRADAFAGSSLSLRGDRDWVVKLPAAVRLVDGTTVEATGASAVVRAWLSPESR